MESVTYSAIYPYITEATQNGNIEDNAKEQESICDEDSEISEGASNEEISDNRLDENIHGEENRLYTLHMIRIG